MIEELKTDLATVDGSAMDVHTGLLATVHDGSPGESRRMGLLATNHDGSPRDGPWGRSLGTVPGDGQVVPCGDGLLATVSDGAAPPGDGP
jgi:hypothetical protein